MTTRPADPVPAVRAMTTQPIPVIRDRRGTLSFAEEGQHVPFTPRRYFTLSDVPAGTIRGDHAHRECHQFFVCLRGSCVLRLDDGRLVRTLTLDTLSAGVHAPPLTWCTLSNFSPDALLLVLTSDLYRDEDYIRTYDEFQRLATSPVSDQ